VLGLGPVKGFRRLRARDGEAPAYKDVFTAVLKPFTGFRPSNFN
jgi:hypothetical protein